MGIYSENPDNYQTRCVRIVLGDSHPKRRSHGKIESLESCRLRFMDVPPVSGSAKSRPTATTGLWTAPSGVELVAAACALVGDGWWREGDHCRRAYTKM